jgi:hypothetical protein
MGRLAFADLKLHGGKDFFFLGFGIQSGDGQPSVGLHFKGELNARGGTRSGRDAVKNEIADIAILGDKLAFALKDVYADGALILKPCGKYFGNDGRKRCPLWDEHACHVVNGFDAQRLGQDDGRNLVHAPAVGAFDYAAERFERGSTTGALEVHG